MTTQRSPIATSLPGRIFFPGRSGSLSSQIVSDVRDALFGKKLKPGDFLGTENDLAGRYACRASSRATRCGRSRRSASSRSRWARGAARGSRAATRGCSPRRWRCSSTSPASVPPRSWTRSARSSASPQSWPPRTPPKPTSRVRALIDDAEAALDDPERFTQLGAEFHLAVAEASHNRVLVVQLISLQHVSWPRRNPTLNAKVARRVNEVHRELLALIEIRDPAGARQLMDDHVKMIRARRVAESRQSFRRRRESAGPGPHAGSSKQPLDSGLRGNERRPG